jgi:hypothetical protein
MTTTNPRIELNERKEQPRVDYILIVIILLDWLILFLQSWF